MKRSQGERGRERNRARERERERERQRERGMTRRVVGCWHRQQHFERENVHE